MPPTPIRNSYWVVPDQLLAGEYPRNFDYESSTIKIKALIDAGITVFIDLSHEKDGLATYDELIAGATHLKFPIQDFSIPDAEEQTRKILDTIDSNLISGKKVYVHCWGGSGRTGLIIGCWLAQHGCLGSAALTRLQELWKQCPKSINGRRSPDNLVQENYIIEWRPVR